MKKSLVVVAVVVCVVCLAVAGSFAIFNTNFDINGGGNSINATTFFIGKTDVKTADVEIAPGEERVWTFGVTNKSGTKLNKVDMDMKITLTVAAKDADAIDNLTVVVVNADGSVIPGVGTLTKGVGTITYTINNAFAKNDTEKTLGYQVLIAWAGTNTEEANKIDTADGMNGAASNVTIKVEGTQVIA